MNFLKDTFLAPEGQGKPAGMFSSAHLILLLFTLSGITYAQIKTASLSVLQKRSVIRCITLCLWILELLKILYKLKLENSMSKYDSWIPLYYCSIAMYAGILSGWGQGLVQRTGDVFLAVGGLIGGVCFLIYPSTSLPVHPWCHFLSLHSFLYHGTMVFLGLMMNFNGLLVLKSEDLILYAVFTLFFCMLAYMINGKCNSNLMFISRPPEGTIVTLLKNMFPNKYTFVTIIGQATLPFGVVMLILKILK